MRDNTEDYKGLEFTTEKGLNCLIADDVFGQDYLIIDIDNFEVLAKDSYENISDLIVKIKNKY
jgi:hypothetical protein